MKFANLIFGFVIFSVVVTIFFTMAKDMTSDFGSSNADKLSELAGKYNFTKDLTTSNQSTIRLMDDQTKVGEASSEDKQVFIVSGVLSASRLITNIIPTLNTIIYQSQGDTGGLIPSVIIDAIIGLIGVFLILVVIHLIMRARSEV